MRMSRKQPSLIISDHINFAIVVHKKYVIKKKFKIK